MRSRGSARWRKVKSRWKWVGVGKDWIEAMAKRQVVWSQEKDRCLELVMDDLEMGGTGEEWAEVLGRLDIQQSCTEEEMVEVTREERPKAGLRAMDVVAEEEMFLQTKIVGLEQVRREMELWVPTMKEEVGALLEKTAIREVREEEVDRWEREGEAVQRAPGKAVFTRKSGDGRRKCRAVVCGNQIQEEVEGGADVYASGVEAGTVRALLGKAAAMRWSVGSLDIRTAFLNAPRRSAHRVVVRPPRILIDAKVVEPGIMWEVTKALYGLRA